MTVSSNERPVLAVGGVVVEHGDGGARVLMIRRGRPPRQGQWSLPGGRVEHGERIVDALRREMKEETGLEVEPGPLLLVAELMDDDHHYVVLDHACRRLSGELRAGDDAMEAEMVLVADLAARGATDLVIEVVRAAFALDLGGAP